MIRQVLCFFVQLRSWFQVYSTRAVLPINGSRQACCRRFLPIRSALHAAVVGFFSLPCTGYTTVEGGFLAELVARVVGLPPPYKTPNQGHIIQDKNRRMCLMPSILFLQANSIEGCKRKEVHVVYTRWQNLKKLASYEAGQVRAGAGVQSRRGLHAARSSNVAATVDALTR